VHSDITHLDPSHPGVRWVVGYLVSAPCQGWTPVGKRAGMDPRNQNLLLEIFARAYEVAFGGVHGPDTCGNELCPICEDDPEWVGDIAYDGSPYTLAEVRAMYDELTDPRLGLITEALIWPLTLTALGGGIQWIAMEQSHALPEIILESLSDHLRTAGWFDVRWQVINAKDFGVASSRPRVFMIAFRYKRGDLSGLEPLDEFAQTSAATALNWPDDVVVNTRGDRTKGGTIKPKGSSGFPVNRPAGSITSKFRNWYWEHDKNRMFTLDEGALLVGFSTGYPWTGSRSSCTQQIGDVVSPVVSAIVIGVILGIPWEIRVRAYLARTYPISFLDTFEDKRDHMLAA
jgi:DNA (cytosine-5)-methyltransferase 1